MIPDNVVSRVILPFLGPQSRSTANVSLVCRQFRERVNEFRRPLLNEIAYLAQQCPTIGVWWEESQPSPENIEAHSSGSDSEQETSGRLSSFFEILDRWVLETPGPERLAVWQTLQRQRLADPASEALALCVDRLSRNLWAVIK
jgi:hypothetical protein